MLIVFLALWLVAISALLRFFAVSTGPHCRVCGGPLELWPDRRRCADCDLVFAEREPARPAARPPALPGRAPRPGLATRYQRAITGSTRSAKSRTLS